jgi:hypothetical protein
VPVPGHGPSTRAGARARPSRQPACWRHAEVSGALCGVNKGRKHAPAPSYTTPLATRPDCRACCHLHETPAAPSRRGSLPHVEGWYSQCSVLSAAVQSCTLWATRTRSAVVHSVLPRLCGLQTISSACAAGSICFGPGTSSTHETPLHPGRRASCCPRRGCCCWTRIQVRQLRGPPGEGTKQR